MPKSHAFRLAEVTLSEALGDSAGHLGLPIRFSAGDFKEEN